MKIRRILLHLYILLDLSATLLIFLLNFERAWLLIRLIIHVVYAVNSGNVLDADKNLKNYTLCIAACLTLCWLFH